MRFPVDLIADKRMKKDFTAYLNADTQEERDKLAKERSEWISTLSADEQAAETARILESVRLVAEGVRANNEELDSRILKSKLGDMPKAISMSYIARTYFGKTSTWLYQRINGNHVNGKEARFTPEEAHQLQDALHDLGRKLSSIVLI